MMGAGLLLDVTGSALTGFNCDTIKVTGLAWDCTDCVKACVAPRMTPPASWPKACPALENTCPLYPPALCSHISHLASKPHPRLVG